MDLRNFNPPAGFDWARWVARWDGMQERYLVRRSERFELMARIVRETRTSVERVLDLGCGTGSLMVAMLEAFPGAEVIGIDFDPAVLWLAKGRLSAFGKRSRVVLEDLRVSSWRQMVHGPVDAVVSATALHWLTSDEVSNVYRQIHGLLRDGGIFLNADHVGSESRRVQEAWERHRAAMQADAADPQSDDWNGFWDGYMRALGLDSREVRDRVVGGWEGGVEEGLPLAWHFDNLRAAGFTAVDCFWRYDCDAVYGGVREVSDA